MDHLQLQFVFLVFFFFSPFQVLFVNLLNDFMLLKVFQKDCDEEVAQNQFADQEESKQIGNCQLW